MKKPNANIGKTVNSLISKIKRVIRIYKKIERNVISSFIYFSKLVAILTVMLLLYKSIDGLLKQSFTIHPFDVPQALYDNGVTGNFTAWQLSDEIAVVQETGWSISGFNIKGFQEDNIEEDIVIFGVSFNTVKSLIRSLLDVEDKAIKGSLLTKANILYLKINFYNFKSIEITSNINEFRNIYEAYDQIISEASLEILHVVDPFTLASFYWAKNELNKSISIIQEMIADKRDDYDSAYLLWGEILAREEKYTEAIDKFQQSVEIDPENVLAWNGWGWVLYLMGGRDDEAILKYKEVVSLTDDIWHTWYHWGLILFRNNQYDEAIKKLKKAIQTDKTQVAAYNEISYVLEAKGEVDTAIAYLIEGIKISPHSGILYASLAEMYWLKNQKEEAFVNLKKSLNLGFDIYQFTEVEPYKSFAKAFPKKE